MVANSKIPTVPTTVPVESRMKKWEQKNEENKEQKKITNNNIYSGLPPFIYS